MDYVQKGRERMREEGRKNNWCCWLSILIYLGDTSCSRKTEIPVKTRQELPRLWEARVWTAFTPNKKKILRPFIDWYYFSHIYKKVNDCYTLRGEDNLEYMQAAKCLWGWQSHGWNQGAINPKSLLWQIVNTFPSNVKKDDFSGLYYPLGLHNLLSAKKLVVQARSELTGSRMAHCSEKWRSYIHLPLIASTSEEKCSF